MRRPDGASSGPQQRRIVRRRVGIRRAFTLIEATISIAVTAILMGAIGSMTFVVSRALPEPGSATSSISEAHDAVALIAAELRCARTIIEMTPTAITFTVPDRNGDGIDETIRYSWSGTAGDALRRTYNGASADLVQKVQTFNLSYDKLAVNTTTTLTSVSTSSEQQLAGFTSWSGVTGSINDFQAASSGPGGSMTGYCAEYFTLAGLPPTTTQVNITKVQLLMKNYPGGSASNVISIRKPASGSSLTPADSDVGTPFTISNASLNAGYSWVTATFSDVSTSNASQGFNIVVRGLNGTPSASVQYLSSTSAPADTPVMFWSNDGGASWNPSANTNQQDLPFAVFGTYTTQTQNQQTVTNYFLRTVSIRLAAGTNAAAHLDTIAQLSNQPAVAGP